MSGSEIATREALLDRIENWQAIFEQNQNPLYVWLAIAYCLQFSEPLPTWCTNYLHVSALDMFALMEAVCGQDFAIDLTRDGGSMTATEAADRVNYALKIKRQGYNAFKQLLSDRQAAGDWATKKSAEHLKELSASFLPLQGKYADEPAKALRKIRERRGIGERDDGTGDDRQLQRQLRKGAQVVHPRVGRDPPRRTKPKG